MNPNFEKKLIHFELNLDYNQDYYDIETQTNLLINKIMNDFVLYINNSYNKLQETTFIYEYNDDLPSLIGYKILLNIQSIKPDFHFKLYGKAKRTKKFLVEKQKFCSKWKLKRTLNPFVISGFNPIYKVADKEYFSNEIVTPKYRLIEQFTPQELYTAQLFYHIGYIKGDIFCQKKNEKIEQYQAFVDDGPAAQSSLNYNLITLPKNIVAARLNENDDNNLKIMQDIEETDKMVLYFYDKKPEILFDKTFSYLVKRTSNRPNEKFLNLNNYEMLKELSKARPDLQIKFIGDWSDTDIKKWRN